MMPHYVHFCNLPVDGRTICILAVRGTFSSRRETVLQVRWSCIVQVSNSRPRWVLQHFILEVVCCYFTHVNNINSKNIEVATYLFIPNDQTYPDSAIV